MLPIDLSGKRAFVAGVADDRGYGWAIVRAACSCWCLNMRGHMAASSQDLYPQSRAGKA